MLPISGKFKGAKADAAGQKLASAQRLLPLFVQHPRDFHQDALRRAFEGTVNRRQGIGVKGKTRRWIVREQHQSVDALDLADVGMNWCALDQVHRCFFGAFEQFKSSAIAGDLEKLQQVHHTTSRDDARKGRALLL